MPIYYGDTNIKVILNVGINIDSAQIMKIIYRKPGGSKEEWEAQKETSTSISYIIPAIDWVGELRLRACVDGKNGRPTSIRALPDSTI